MTDFDRLTAEIFDFLMKSNPVWATSAGIHDYDDQLPALSPVARQERIDRLTEYGNRLQAFDKAGELDEDGSLDCKLLLGTVENELIEEQQINRSARDPNVPLQMALFGCFKLMSGDFAPLEERAYSALGRLQQVPRILQEGKANLEEQKEIPTVWAEMAEELAVIAMTYFGMVIPSMTESVKKHHEAIAKAGNAAASICAEYLKFLQEEMTERSKGSYAVGTDVFEQLLKAQHGLDYSCEELLQIGEEAIAATEEQMDKLVDEIKPGANRQEVIEALKQDYPSDEKLVATYGDEVDKLRKFIVDKKIVSLPEEDHLDVMETPDFARPVLPFAAYSPPAPFDKKRRGALWVTPINSEAPPEKQEEQRRGQNRHSLLLIALHETYPGHHLQLATAAAQESRVRRLAHSSLFAEGWALYCEELLEEQGYYTEPGTRLMKLVHQLWRACRVVIAVSLHTGTMTFTDAVNLLMEKVNVDKINAIAEVKRYTQSPTQPQSYLVGKLELMKLRERSQQKLGKNHNLRSFHDRLLSFGTVPISLIADRILEQ
jgi:uncharacterized protein (DUF885 family)